MPLKSCGIHEFSGSVTKALDPGDAKKSWMPREAPRGAFAGMTRFSFTGMTRFARSNRR
jgi:hypothetical protein